VVGIAEEVGRAEDAVFRQLRLDLEGDGARHFEVAALQRRQLGALAEERAGGVHRHLDLSAEPALHPRLDLAEGLGERRRLRRRRGDADFGLGQSAPRRQDRARKAERSEREQGPFRDHSHVIAPPFA
jgi:hypothetical protein